MTSASKLFWLQEVLASLPVRTATGEILFCTDAKPGMPIRDLGPQLELMYRSIDKSAEFKMMIQPHGLKRVEQKLVGGDQLVKPRHA